MIHALSLPPTPTFAYTCAAAAAVAGPIAGDAGPAVAAAASMSAAVDELSDMELEHVVGGLARAWGADVSTRSPSDILPLVLVSPTLDTAHRIPA